MAQKRLQPVPVPTGKSNAKKPDNGEKTELRLVSRHRGGQPQDKGNSHPETIALLMLILFLLLNVGGLMFDAISPDRLRLAFGELPDPLYLNLAYAVYVVTEAGLIISRLSCKPLARYACRQLTFLTAFYLFVWFSGAMEEHLLMLLVTGVGLLFGEYARLLHISVKAADFAVTE